jgi:ketosteroid isomerase-like protein
VVVVSIRGNSFVHGKKMKGIALAVWVAAAACAVEPVEPAKPVETFDPAVLMAADREFAAETAQRGTAGWVDAFAADGKLVSGGGVVDGRDAVEQVMGVLDGPDYSLTWEPEFAEGSGDLGYTYGSYRRETLDADGGAVVETGRYVTVWRRDADGEWRVVLDIGSAAP